MDTEFLVKKEMNSCFLEGGGKGSSLAEILISNDNEYLEEYFRVCELFQKKRVLINKLMGNAVNNPKEDKPDLESIQKEITGLNALIKQKEAQFWPKVAKAKESGIKFTFESFSKKYKLDLFETRVIIFFFYLEFCNVSENICFEDELIRTFDLDDSVMWRMRNFAYFGMTSKLVNNIILDKEFKTTDKSATAHFALQSWVINEISRQLSGRKLSKIKDRHIFKCEEVGYIKTPEFKIEEVSLKSNIKDKIMFHLSGINNKSFDKLKVSRKIKRAKGLTFLFYGPPGTGKSMLAEAMSGYLKKKMLIVEFPKILSRWYGDTDKNISKMFDTARKNDLVLCIDEADSLLYNRNFAVQEHDIRFVNDMLSELERFEGVAVLTTNMDNLLDQALERRISLRVKFELPDEKTRAQIWKTHIPESVKLSEDVDFDMLASKYNFSGGYIRNAVLNSLRRVALKKQDTLTMDDLIFGADMENEGMFNKEVHKGVMGFAMQ